ncbi:MAG TPA: DNA-binding response regulator [Deltaproteobacteria bacterium]|nr:DNA-binding response regulator [Deltaproteobacteria bacterium]
MKPTAFLIVDDEPSIVKIFERVARGQKWSHAAVRDGRAAIDFIAKNDVEMVLLDIHLPAYSGFQVLEFIKSTKPAVEVVIVTGRGSVEQAVQALKQGAFDYLTKPFSDMNKVISTLNNAVEKHRLVRRIHELQISERPLDGFQGIVGRARVMQDLYALIASLQNSSASVLIEGESGTGKELVAQAIHRTSKRAKRPFLVVNCAAIPEGLLESELFGHVRGAFTGAVADKRGLFEMSDGGTLFLDEIGEVTSSFQVKLLRVLQDGTFKRVGEGESRRSDVRIIAATNRDLQKRIQEGAFREDLYYRLHVIGVRLPPLRERKEDIPLLVRHFLTKFNEGLNKEIREVSLDAMQALETYAWVGNVRELENAVERSAVLAGGDVIRAKDLPRHILSNTFYPRAQEDIDFSRFNYKEAKNRALELFNKSYLQHLLQQSGGNISLASDRAGMDRSNFKKIIRKFEVDIREFKKG